MIVRSATAAGAAGPPGSTMMPLVAMRSSSPSPPSVIEKVTVLPMTTAVGSVYQWGVASAEVGPYFQYCVPAGRACGYVMVKLSTLPGVQPLAVNAMSPCGKGTPAGALPAGGEAALPVSGMYCGAATETALPATPALRVSAFNASDGNAHIQREYATQAALN